MEFCPFNQKRETLLTTKFLAKSTNQMIRRLPDRVGSGVADMHHEKSGFEATFDYWCSDDIHGTVLVPAARGVCPEFRR